jgi:hypothetical protein
LVMLGPTHVFPIAAGRGRPRNLYRPPRRDPIRRTAPDSTSSAPPAQITSRADTHTPPPPPPASGTAPFLGRKLRKAKIESELQRFARRSQREAQSYARSRPRTQTCNAETWRPLEKASSYASRIATKRRQEEGEEELFNATAGDDGWTPSGRPARQVDERVRGRAEQTRA